MAPSLHLRVGTTGAYAALLLVLVVVGTPTRVGDGGEYLAMAMNLSRLEPPALSLADLARVDRRLDTLGPSFQVRNVRFPSLVGSDGRQDFPHFWMYPLLVSPVLAATDALGLHPNYAFAVFNVLILAWAWWLVVPRLGTWLTALALVSPIVWWIDKAHGDVFTYALLTVGLALLTTRPVGGVVALGLACSQNPPLAVTLPVMLVAAWHQAVGWSPSRACTVEGRPLLKATIVAIGLAALPMAYYYARLGVPTPLVGWTSRHVPSAGDLARFVTDPNIGVAWAFPGAIVVTLAALIAMSRRTPRRLLHPALLAGPACAVLLLAGFSQSLNINHGATPSVNRWSLWLVPLALPLWQAWHHEGLARAGLVRTVAHLSMALSLWVYAPLSSERYVHPTRVAQWLWESAPGLDNPPLEIFAERASRSEPPFVPVAMGGCTKVLVSEGRWPAPCTPAPLPPECRHQGQHCYANAAHGEYNFVPVPMRTGFGFLPNPRTWPTGDATTATLRAALEQSERCGARVAPAGETGSVIRATHRIEWTVALQCPSEFLLYLAGLGEGAHLTLRLPRSMAMRIDDLGSLMRIERDITIDNAWDPVVVDLPASEAGVLLHLR